MTSRGPNSVYEQRIDFEGIDKAQNNRHRDTLKDLRSILFAMQRRTLSWAEENLVRRKSRTSINGFTIPQPFKYRAVLRKRMEAAARRGHRDVQNELDRKSLPFRGPDRSKARERADTLSEDHLGRLTQDLKSAWNLAMQGVVDRSQIRYVTKKVFADFAGWEQPEV